MIGKVIGIGIILWVLSQRKSSRTAVERPVVEELPEDVVKVEDTTEIEEIEDPEPDGPTHSIKPGSTINPVERPFIPAIERKPVLLETTTTGLCGLDWKTRARLRRKKRI